MAGSCSWKFLISSRQISGVKVRVPNGAMSSSARSNSSIEGVVAVLPKHCLQSGRQTPSALQ